MYLVIFIAEINQIDDEYEYQAKRMRELALNKYLCKRIESVTEIGRQITISYWQSEADIVAWKNDAEHRAVQKVATEKWYKSYKVEITELSRSYSSD